MHLRHGEAGVRMSERSGANHVAVMHLRHGEAGVRMNERSGANRFGEAGARR
jgi:hypothetical protein